MCPPSAGATRLWEHASPKESTSGLTEHTPVTAPACVPNDEASQAAYAHAQKYLHPTILNHSLRVYLLAHGLGTREDSPYVYMEKLRLLFAACIMHDVGTSEAHNGAQRFEVEGADAAVGLLKSLKVSETETHDVWTAIAMHTSPGIAERISELSWLVRMGVAMDFKRPSALEFTTTAEIASVERLFPRGEIEKVLGDAVVGQVAEHIRRKARGNGEKAKEIADAKAPPATWPGGLVKWASENIGWEGVNKAF